MYNEYTTLLSSLNTGQKQVLQSCVDHATLWFKSTLDKSTPPPPLHVFVSGGAGTGKSFLLKAIHTYLLHSAFQNPVVLTAPTGVAAYNIGGLTIHRAFNKRTTCLLLYKHYMANENCGSIMSCLSELAS